MGQKIDKTQIIINKLLVIFSFLLLLTPLFILKSAHFEWGFAAFIYVTVPLLFGVPALLLVQVILLLKYEGKKLHWWVWCASLLIWLIMLLLVLE